MSMTTAQFRGEFEKNESEADFQEWVIDAAHKHGWKVAHFRGVRIQRADGSTYYQTPVQADGKGFPDLVLVRDRVIFAELKRENGKPDPNQEAWLAALQVAGANWYVWKPRDRDLILRVLA